MLKKNRIISGRDFFNIILLIMCVLARGSAISICLPNISHYTIFLFVIVFCLFLLKDKGKLSITIIQRNPHLLILIVVLLPSMFFNIGYSNLIADIVLIVSSLIAYIISIHDKKEKLIEYYIRTMHFLCVISLLCFAMFNVFHFPSDWMLHLYKISDIREEFRSIIVYSIRMNDFQRNCGPFWEPSIFAAYTGFALIFQLFYTPTIKRNTTMVFILTILSTMSTGGIILLLLVILLWMWKKNNGNLFVKVLTIAVVMLFILMQDVFSDALLKINYELFSKLIHFTENKSSMSRIFSVLINLEIWKENILFGVGPATVDDLYHSTKMCALAVSSYQMFPSQSATPFIFLSSFGICGVYYSYLWIKIVLNSKDFNAMQKLIFSFFIFFIVTETPHTHFILTYYIICMLLHKDHAVRISSES